jgi:hypothetical protein
MKYGHSKFQGQVLETVRADLLTCFRLVSVVLRSVFELLAWPFLSTRTAVRGSETLICLTHGFYFPAVPKPGIEVGPAEECSETGPMRF